MDKRLKMPSEIVQLRLNLETSNGDPAVNVLYMHYQVLAAGIGHDAPFTNGNADLQASKLLAAFGASLSPIIGNGTAAVSCDWCWNEAVGVGPLHEGTYTPVAPIGGAVAGPFMPNGIAKAMEFRTGLGGRGNHGRMFLTGFTTSQSLGGTAPDTITAAAKTAMDAAAAGWLASLNNNSVVAGAGDDYKQCVVSFVLTGALRAVAVHHDVTQTLFRDNLWDYQRRRALGHGRHH